MKFWGNFVDRAIFPGTESSYDLGSCESIYSIDSKPKIPFLFFPCHSGSSIIIVYAHGNGTDLGDIMGRLEKLSIFLKVHVIAFDYPGYGCYEGQSDVETVDNTLHSIISFICNSFAWPLENIVLYGCSIGTGPCTRFARYVAVSERHYNNTSKQDKAYCFNSCSSTKKPQAVSNLKAKHNSLIQGKRLGGLILQCPFRSIRHAAERYIGRLSAKLFIGPRWSVEDELKECECPLLCIHGKKDEMFNYNGTLNMYNQYSNRKMIHLPENATHLNFNFENDILTPIRSFIKNLVLPNAAFVPHYLNLFNLNFYRVDTSKICPIPLPIDSSILPSIRDLIKHKVEFLCQNRTFEFICSNKRSYYSIIVNPNSEIILPLNIIEASAVSIKPSSCHTLGSAKCSVNNAQEHDEYESAQVTKIFDLKTSCNVESKFDEHMSQLWPESQFMKYIKTVFYEFGFYLLCKVKERNMLQSNQSCKFDTVVQFIRRMITIRFRHNLSLDLLYKANNDNLNEFNLEGLIVAGLLLRINNNSLKVEKLASIADDTSEWCFKKNYLIQPVFTPPSDIYFPIARWVLLASVEYAKLTDLAELPYLHTLEEIASNWVHDFLDQIKRPIVERLGFNFGNCFTGGFEQLLGKIIDHWDWFESRLIYKNKFYITTKGWTSLTYWTQNLYRYPIYAQPNTPYDKITPMDLFQNRTEKLFSMSANNINTVKALIKDPRIKIKHEEKNQIILKDYLFLETSIYWLCSLDSRFIHPENIKFNGKVDLINLKNDRAVYMALCSQLDCTTKPSIIHHNIFHHVLINSRYYMPEAIAYIDSLWRVVEILSGDQWDPDNIEDSGGSDVYPTEEHKKFLANLNLAIIFIQRLIRIARDLYRHDVVADDTVLLELQAAARFSSNQYTRFPGILYPCVRLFDEIRFTLLTKENDPKPRSTDYIIGYQQIVNDWKSGSTSFQGSCYVLTELETVYSILIDALDYSDRNNAFPLSCTRSCTLDTAECLMKATDDIYLRWLPTPFPLVPENIELMECVQYIHSVMLHFILTPVQKNLPCIWWKTDQSWIASEANDKLCFESSVDHEPSSRDTIDSVFSGDIKKVSSSKLVSSP